VFFGSPLPTIGHNEQLGWTFTVNKPDTCDSWMELFDDSANPLAYKYGEGHRTAIEWKDTIKMFPGEITRLAVRWAPQHVALSDAGPGQNLFSFDPKQVGLQTPENRTRPGGSFGVGIDVIETDKLAIGGLMTYNGVVLASGSSRSYMVAALTLTFKPSAY